MAKNDFKAFATGESANVLTQAEYEELAALPAGFSSGIARSEQLNKVWRQASTIAAVVSSFMADKSGDDVLDEGDISALKATLVKALLANSRTQLDDVYLQKARSLADLPNKLTARQNLELDKVGNFTSVQQGGGDGMLTNKVYVGWNGTKMIAQVDAVRMGDLYYGNNPPPYPVTSVNTKTGAVTLDKSDVGLGNVGNWPAVQANGGLHSSGNHRYYMDWGTDGKLHITVDSTDVGELFTTQNPPNAAQTGAYPKTGGILNEEASVTVISNTKNGNSGQSLYSPMFRACLKNRGGDMDFKDGASACFRMVEVVSNYAFAEVLIDGFGLVQSFAFRNDGSFRSPSSVYAGGAFMPPDGNVYGSMWGGYLNNWINGQLGNVNNAINGVRGTANDAWNKAQDAQVNRVSDVALGGEGAFQIVKNGQQRVPGGCVMTGWNFEGDNPGGDTVFYRPVQKHYPSIGWVNVGHTA